MDKNNSYGLFFMLAPNYVVAEKKKGNQNLFCPSLNLKKLVVSTPLPSTPRRDSCQVWQPYV